jgi:GNAT superfamily N-acetyltransferase
MASRVGTLNDLEDVKRLHALAWKEYEAGSEMPSWDTPGDAKDFVDPFLEAGQIVVAEKDGKIVGMVSVGLWEDWWMLLNIVVDEDCRGNGIASDMVHRATELARGKGAKRGYIWAPNRLEKFYEEAGYQPVGKIMVMHA